MSQVTLDQVKQLLPKNSRRIVTEDTINIINSITDTDGEDFAASYRENFIGFTKVLQTGEYKIDDYIRAVKYVSYKLMEHSNLDSYMLTFPDRYERLMEKYKNLGNPAWIRDNKISPYVSAYNKNILVNRILEQTLIPTHILNAPLYQQALNVQVDLMLHARSEMVRSNAANSVLAATAAPETTKIELDMSLKENSTIADLRKVTQELAAQHALAVKSGVTTVKEIGASKIITGDSDFIEGEIDD